MFDFRIKLTKQEFRSLIYDSETKLMMQLQKQTKIHFMNTFLGFNNFLKHIEYNEFAKFLDGN